jgi:hypothetical protein
MASFRILRTAVAVAALGCAGGPGPGAASPDTGVSRVRVENQNWSDVNVYAVAGTQRHRLGLVVLTDPILVGKGEQIELRVMNHLALSSVSVHHLGLAR